MASRDKTPRDRLAKRLFALRSFKGADPEQIRRRFKLVTGLVMDVLEGRLSEATAKRLVREGSDAIKAGGVFGPGPTLSPRTQRRVVRGLLAVFGRDHTLWRRELMSRQPGRTRRF